MTGPQEATTDYAFSGYLDELVYCSGARMVTLLDELSTTLPRTLRTDALRNVLSPYFTEERQTLIEEEEKSDHPLDLNKARRLSRLKWHDKLCETQLENELIFYHGQTLIKDYLQTLWRSVLDYLLKTGVEERYLNAFIKESIEEIRVRELPVIEKFNSAFSAYLFDEKNAIDGIEYEQFKEVLFHTANTKEIKQIGQKYDVEVPRTLNKNGIRNILVNALKRRNQLTSDLEAEIENGSLQSLTKLAKDHNINASIYLTKEQMIEHIIDNATPLKGTAFQEETAALESFEDVDAAIRSLQDDMAALKKLIHKQLEQSDRNAATNADAGGKKPFFRKVPVLDMALGTMLLFMTIGLISYFLQDFGMFSAINSLINNINFRGQGVMEIYHGMLDFIIAG